MTGAPDCAKCIYRRSIPGDAHSKCEHPEADWIGMYSIMAYGSVSYQSGLRVEGDLRSAQAGWFFWPSNYDPRWLKSCNGFKEKEAAHA
jgi:hypothetical protein